MVSVGLGQSDWLGRSKALGQENLQEKPIAGFLSTQPQGIGPSEAQQDYSAE